MAKKLDKKFVLLIVIILCTLAAGFYLTYLSSVTEIQSGLRGIERKSLESHTLFDSDHEPQTIEPDNEPRSIEPSNLAFDSVVLPNFSISINETELTGLSTANFSIPLVLENSMQALNISQSIIVNNSLFDLPFQMNVSTIEPSMLLTSAPTMQPSIVDELQDFLIPLTNGTQELLSQISRSFWSSKAENLLDPSGQTIESPALLIAHFHSALKYGEICSDPTTKNSKIKLNKKVEMAFKDLIDPSGLSSIHQAVLRQILSSGTNLFFEYSRLDLKFRQAVSFSVSSHSPHCYSILFSSSERNLPRDKRICGAMRYPNSLNPPSNLLIASPPSANYFKETRWIDQYDCVQLVNSFEDVLPAFNADTFPFEFEDALGSLLCRCNLTALPSQLPPLSYFTYWISVELLLEESARSVADICSFEVNRTEGRKFQRNEYLWIARRNPERIQQLTPNIIFASYSLHPLSRYHVLTNMIPPSSNHSLSGSLEKRRELLLPLETSLLTSNFFISSNRYQSHLFGGIREQNKQRSLVQEEPTLKPTSPFSHRYSFLPLSSQNTTAMTFPRKLSEIRSFNPISFPAELNRFELSKKRPQVFPPPRSTFWIASHREVKNDEFDEWLERDQSRQMNQLQENDDDEETHPARSSSRVELLSWSSRRQQRALRMREDRYQYRRWTNVLHSIKIRQNGYPLFYLIGSHTTLLSVKLAQQLMKASRTDSQSNRLGLVLSLHTDSQSWEPHRELLETLEIPNNFISYKQLTVAMIASLSLSPELAELIILQYDVFVLLLSLAVESIENNDQRTDHCLDSLKLFEEMIGVFIRIGKNVLFEIPELNTFSAIASLLFKQTMTEDCIDTFLARYSTMGDFFERVTDSLALHHDLQIKLCRDNQSTNCLHLRINEIDQNDFMAKHLRKTFKIFHLRFDLISEADSDIRVQDHGLSVYTLTHFNIDPNLKRLVFKMYLELPLFAMSTIEKKIFSPWSTYLQCSFNPQTHALDLDLFLLASLQDPQLNKMRVSTQRFDLQSLRLMSDLYWQAIQREFGRNPAELGPENRFSFVEHNSDIGLVSAQIAREYSNATVISLERNEKFVTQHVNMVTELQILNNIVCLKTDDDSYISQRIYESPELFRFQLMSRGLLDSFADATDLDTWGKDIGNFLSTALTTFISVPSSVQVSLSMYLFMESSLDGIVTGPYRSPHDVFDSLEQKSGDIDFGFLNDLNSIAHHPRVSYRGFETNWLFSYLRVEGGSTEISLTSVYPDGNSFIPILVRSDIKNMTRHVHHHYDYAKDGHTRTYTMHVEINISETTHVAELFHSDVSSLHPLRLNETIALSQSSPLSPPFRYLLPLGMHCNQHEIVSVRLYRDKDSFFIPYTSIYGVTLISLLRLGLEKKQRERLFSSFLRLPLYEDMAPWNIVLMGKEMEYIDYDTRDLTFDLDVPKSYQVISVLMNYKRTVEDFRRCGGKAPTVYGLAFISDCVASINAPICNGLQRPVPCADGTCHTDYISCLRSITLKAESLVAENHDEGDQLSRAIVASMKSGIAKFNNRGLE